MGFVVLDVTRTLSQKSIETPTGIDRVERAYIRHFLRRNTEALFAARVGRRVVLMDCAQMMGVFDRLLSGDPKPASTDFRSRVKGLIGLDNLSGLPDQFTYVNVGHTHLEEDWLKRMRANGAQKIIGMVHDMIPLDYPELQTPKSVVQFEARMRALGGAADLILTNSAYTQARVADWFERWGLTPQSVVNPLGVDRLRDVPARTFARPAFVVLGTIEPRKNHRLLLDVWESFADISEAHRPQLHIIGRRGWRNEDVFARLDASPMMGRDVFEHGRLGDADVAACVRGAHALLFPSLVEGYGLPILESYCVGTPTIASDIDAFREFRSAVSLYLNPFDATVWRKAIKEQSNQGKDQINLEVDEQFFVPDWETHFAFVEAHL